ncbi:Csu type fimbrial protein [Billgrantia endophytica]|nr:spore coat U domain-containing protein [Halomonas endophytica]
MYLRYRPDACTIRRLCAALCACVVVSAHAAETSILRVWASITPGCQINGVISPEAGKLGTLDFGRHPAIATDSLVTGFAANAAVTLSCTPGVALSMSLDGGSHFANGERNLDSGSHRIPYQLYRDAGLSQAVPVNQSVAVVYDNPNDIRLPIYAALQLPGLSPPGTYQDVLTVTLSW